MHVYNHMYMHLESAFWKKNLCKLHFAKGHSTFLQDKILVIHSIFEELQSFVSKEYAKQGGDHVCSHIFIYYICLYIYIYIF